MKHSYYTVYNGIFGLCYLPYITSLVETDRAYAISFHLLANRHIHFACVREGVIVLNFGSGRA